MLPGLDLVPPNTVVPLRDQLAVRRGGARRLQRRARPRAGVAGVPDAAAGDLRRPLLGSRRHPRPPDIPPLADWGDRPLGGAHGAADERFVVLLRSRAAAPLPRRRRLRHQARRADRRCRSSTGAMEPDVRFFGFDIAAAEIGDWSIVIAEQPTAPRFGVEVDEVPVGRQPPAPRRRRRRRRPPRPAAAPAAGAHHDPGRRAARWRRARHDHRCSTSGRRSPRRSTPRPSCSPSSHRRPPAGAAAGAPRDPVLRPRRRHQPSCASGCTPTRSTSTPTTPG